MAEEVELQPYVLAPESDDKLQRRVAAVSVATAVYFMGSALVQLLCGLLNERLLENNLRGLARIQAVPEITWVIDALPSIVLYSAMPLLVGSFLTGCLFATCGLMGAKGNSECCACCYCCCNACYCLFLIPTMVLAGVSLQSISSAQDTAELWFAQCDPKLCYPLGFDTAVKTTIDCLAPAVWDDYEPQLSGDHLPRECPPMYLQCEQGIVEARELLEEEEEDEPEEGPEDPDRPPGDGSDPDAGADGAKDVPEAGEPRAEGEEAGADPPAVEASTATSAVDGVKGEDPDAEEESEDEDAKDVHPADEAEDEDAKAAGEAEEADADRPGVESDPDADDEEDEEDAAYGARPFEGRGASALKALGQMSAALGEVLASKMPLDPVAECKPSRIVALYKVARRESPAVFDALWAQIATRLLSILPSFVLLALGFWYGHELWCSLNKASKGQYLLNLRPGASRDVQMVHMSQPLMP